MRKLLSNVLRSFLIALILGVAPLALSATFNIANGDVTALSNAITTANSNNQDDTINLAAGGNYPTTSTAVAAFPVIASDNGHALAINGQGATVTLASVQSNTHLFVVTGNNVTFSNVILSHAIASTDGGTAANAQDFHRFRYL